MSVLNTNQTNHLEQPIFLGEAVSIARFDKVKYNQFEKLTERQLGFFWLPQEIQLVSDKKDFNSLSKQEQFIFTSNLKRQILLDSVQGRAISAAFGSIVSLPEVETFMKIWEAMEQVHSRSYTYIIRHIYPDPSEIIDGILDIEEIVDCAKDISKDYDALVKYNNLVDVFGYGSKITADDGGDEYLDEYEHKRLIWRTLHAVNALEGIRFYVSFICSWAFAEQKKMAGNAKIIKLICRDENVHLAATQQLIKLLPKEDPDFAKLSIEEEEYNVNTFKSVIDQEKVWAKFLTNNGSMLGLNYDILCETVDHFAAKRANAIGITGFKNIPNPLPWSQKWISGTDEVAVQARPQEESLTEYRLGGIKSIADKDTFKDWKL